MPPTLVNRVVPVFPYLEDGHAIFVACALDPAIEFWEIGVKPPGIDNGDPIDITTQFNVLWRGKAPRSLLEHTDIEGTAAFAPSLITNLIVVIGIVTSWTVMWPNGDRTAFWAYLKDFDPDEEEEGSMPTGSFTIVITNRNPGTRAEEGPVFDVAPPGGLVGGLPPVPPPLIGIQPQIGPEPGFGQMGHGAHHQPPGVSSGGVLLGRAGQPVFDWPDDHYMRAVQDERARRKAQMYLPGHAGQPVGQFPGAPGTVPWPTRAVRDRISEQAEARRQAQLQLQAQPQQGSHPSPHQGGQGQGQSQQGQQGHQQQGHQQHGQPQQAPGEPQQHPGQGGGTYQGDQHFDSPPQE